MTQPVYLFNGGIKHFYLTEAMKAIFRTFESGAGDCMFLVLKDEKDGSSYHIMVDCNVLTSDIEQFIREDLKSRIDTLIITHIDADHANGIIKLMHKSTEEDLHLGQILFNGFQPQTIQLKKLDAKTREKLDAAADRLPPVIDEHYHKTSGRHAARLITELNNHPKWKKVWCKKPISAGGSIRLSNDSKWGYLKFLSPSKNALDALLDDVKKEYAKLLCEAPPDGDFEDQEKYFELMLRLAGFRKRPAISRKTKGMIITKKALERYAKTEADEGNITSANKASLAFYWEGGNSPKRILMLGDAVSSQVLSQLDKISAEEIWFEAIKVSHHGSKNNTSISFNAKVNSNHYFLTGGKENEGPHIETIAKIATKPLIEDRDCRKLHYNHTYRYSLWDNLDNNVAKDLLNEYHLKLTKDNIYEFEY